MTRVLKTRQADIDLDEIWLHVALDNMPAADRLIDKIVSRAWTFAGQPLSGRARPELADDLRSFPMDAYVVFYTPLDDGIRLVRVLHSARDLDTKFEA